MRPAALAWCLLLRGASGVSTPLRFVRSAGCQGDAFGEFRGPRHMGALTTGGIVVVDGLNQRIHVLDKDARTVRIVEGLITPTGVAVDHDTLYWAESTGAHRVNRLRLSSRSASTAARRGIGKESVSVRFSGRFRPWAAATTSVGGLGDGHGELHDPQCLAIAGGLLFVAEWGNHRVSVFEKESLAFVRHIGHGDADDLCEGGDRPGELNQPCGVAAHAGEVFVADTWNHRVCVYREEDGSFARSFGGRGTAPGQFTYPMGLTVAHDRLYVAERTGKRVQVLSLAGEPLQALPSPCGGWLYGVCADGDRVWLTSSSENRVHLLTTGARDQPAAAMPLEARARAPAGSEWGLTF